MSWSPDDRVLMVQLHNGSLKVLAFVDTCHLQFFAVLCSSLM